MAAVAADAGVSLKTVYVAFETKSGLLRAVWHRVLRGDGDGVPVGDQPWFRRVLDEPDPRTQLRLNAQNSREVKERAGPIMEVIRAAAPGDAEIGALWQRIETEFHANQRQVIESLHRKHALRKGLGVAAAADILWALNHPGVYQSLVGDRGWSAGPLRAVADRHPHLAAAGRRAGVCASGVAAGLGGAPGQPATTSSSSSITATVSGISTLSWNRDACRSRSSSVRPGRARSGRTSR